MTKRMDRKAFRCAVAGVLALVGLSVALPSIPFVISAIYRDKAEALRSRLAEVTRASQTAQAAPRSLVDSGLLLTGPTSGVAEASLQRNLLKLLQTAGGKLTAVQVLPRRQDTADDWIKVSLRMRLTIKQLRRFLFDVERGRPLMFVDAMSIHPLISSSGQHSSSAPSVLDVTVKVSGRRGKRLPGGDKT